MLEISHKGLIPSLMAVSISAALLSDNSEAVDANAACTKVDILDYLSDETKRDFQVSRLQDVYYSCDFDGTPRLMRVFGFRGDVALPPSEVDRHTSVYANNWGSIYRLPLEGTVFYSSNPGSNFEINVGGDSVRQERDGLSSRGSDAWRNLVVLDVNATLQNQDILNGDQGPNPQWALSTETMWVENGSIEVLLKATFRDTLTLKDSDASGTGSITTASLQSYGDSSLTMSDFYFSSSSGNASLIVHDGHFRLRDDLDASRSAVDVTVETGSVFEIVNTSTVLFAIQQGTFTNNGTVTMTGSGPSIELDSGVTFEHHGLLDVNSGSTFDTDGIMNIYDSRIHSLNGELDINTVNLEGDALFELAFVGASGLNIETLNVNTGHSGMVTANNQVNEVDIKVGQVEISSGAALTLGLDTISEVFHVNSGGRLEVIDAPIITWKANPNNPNVIHIEDGGTLAFGGTATQTLSADGNVVIDGNLIIRVDGNTNTHDTLRVGVNNPYDITLGANSTLEIQGLGTSFNAFAQANPVIRVIEGTNGLSGQFASISDDLHFYDFTPNYTSRDLELIIEALPVATTHTANATKNHKDLQNSIGKAVAKSTPAGGTTPPVNPPHQNCANYTASMLCITGNQTLDNHLNAYLVSSGGSIDQFHDTASGEAYANHLSVLMRSSEAVSNSVSSYLSSGLPLESGASSDQNGTWLDVYNIEGNIESFEGISGYEYNHFGVVIGHDIIQSGTTKFGLFFGYGESELSETAHDHARANDDSLSFGAYTSFGVLGGEIDSVIGLTRNSSSMTRSILLNTTEEMAQSEYDSKGLFLQTDYSYPMRFGQLSVDPYIGFLYTSLDTDQINESSASVLDLKVDSAENSSLKGRAGATIGYSFNAFSGYLTPYLRGGYTYDNDADTAANNDIRVTFSEANDLIDPHTQVGHNRGKEIIELDIGLEFTSINQKGYIRFGKADFTHGDEEAFEAGYVIYF